MLSCIFFASIHYEIYKIVYIFFNYIFYITLYKKKKRDKIPESKVTAIMEKLLSEYCCISSWSTVDDALAVPSWHLYLKFFIVL